jgi:hypothetical protein
MRLVSQTPDNSVITKYVDENHAVVLEKGLSNEWEVASQSPLLEPYVEPTPYVPDMAAMRREAYQKESDPLYFKWQRGEATQQEWLDKIAEIKTR